MCETILLKFGVWGAEGGRRLPYKNDLSSAREHRATYVWKLNFSSLCKYTDGVARRLTWPHYTLFDLVHTSIYFLLNAYISVSAAFSAMILIWYWYAICIRNTVFLITNLIICATLVLIICKRLTTNSGYYNYFSSTLWYMELSALWPRETFQSREAKS